MKKYFEEYFNYCSKKNFPVISFMSYKKFKRYKKDVKVQQENLAKLDAGLAGLFDSPDAISCHPDFKSKKWN